MRPDQINPSFDLPVLNESMRRTTAAWLFLGLAALVTAGLYSLLLVLARTPAIQELIPLTDFFHIALVVHVDLSVLIWLLSMAGVFWSLGSGRDLPGWDRLSFWLAAAGTAIVIVSPFLGAGRPLMNNYVPVLQHPVFFAGLGLFTFGISSHLLRSLVSRRLPPAADVPGMNSHAALRFGITVSAAVTLVAMLAFLASFYGVSSGMEGQVYYEFVFWGGGHILQFAYTVLMLIAWVVLASQSQCKFVLTPRLATVFFLILALPVLTVPLIYIAHDVVSAGHRLAFTDLMKYGGLSCLPLGLAVLVSVFGADKAQGEGRHLRSALLASMGLFTVGGVLGFLISGLDIVIPAHYHGSTVGVTLAFMGLAYYLLPRLGYGPVPPRMAYWQPYIYGGGQLMHIAGLAWSGGYGVQRKTAGSAQGLDQLGEIAGMGLMGLGGLVSVIGGLLFLIVAYKSIRTPKS